MEEIKGMLVGMQNQINGMQNQMNNMQSQMDGMQNQMNGMQNQMDGMQNQINGMENRMDGMQNQINGMQVSFEQKLQEGLDSVRKELKEEIRGVNQRLAVFQEDITPKINILFDSDTAIREHLEFYDSEICEIKKEQFEQALRISRLEQKVIGA